MEDASLNMSESFTCCNKNFFDSIRDVKSSIGAYSKPRVRNIQRLNQMKIVRALPLNSMIREITQEKKIKREVITKRNYSLGKSQEEIGNIYKINKFKKTIRMNLFLDNLVLGLTKIDSVSKKKNFESYKAPTLN